MFRSSIKVHATGLVDLDIMFNVGTGDKTDHRTYFEKQDADKYLYQSKRDFILILFERYVNHARIVMETGINRAFYQTESRCRSMDNCFRANTYFQDQSLSSICQLLVKMENDLRNILPSPSNNSFESSKNRMWDILSFAREQVENSNITSIKKELQKT